MSIPASGFPLPASKQPVQLPDLLFQDVYKRQIFIREALVNGDYETKAPFFAHNQRLIREIENLEHKSRRTDVLIDEELIAAFYDQHLPPSVINGFSFEKWHKEATKENPKLLFLNRDDLMRLSLIHIYSAKTVSVAYTLSPTATFGLAESGR